MGMTCYHCKVFKENTDTIHCDDCRWDLHYSRNWHYKDYTKEEWKNEQRNERLPQM